MKTGSTDPKQEDNEGKLDTGKLDWRNRGERFESLGKIREIVGEEAGMGIGIRNVADMTNPRALR